MLEGEEIPLSLSDKARSISWPLPTIQQGLDIKTLMIPL